ncbi:tetratricopeptide repeat protein [Larkinella soli]|uniref:tetratricopeptide repeat protein n=1 Tax=Larkinella soli TaxID=1770527 RepID=UPI0013E4034A|nr:tetratricopeptide repeat protein [Larkinella soli]
MVLFAYSFGFSNDFVDWDDAEYVFGNPYVLNPTPQRLRTLLDAVVALNFHPLTMLSLAANSALFGPGPTSFILTNTLIHVLNTGLVYGLAYQLSHRNRQVGLYTALIWGLHPMHVESVIWVSERKDVLYTFFFLSACLTYLKYQSAPAAGKPAGYPLLFITYIFFVLSCLSKAMAVVFPVVLLLLDFMQAGPETGWQGRPGVNSLLEKLPFFAVAILFGLIAVDVQAGGDFHGLLVRISEKKDAVGQEPFAARWLVYGSYGFTMYLVKLLLPFRLSAFYPYPEVVTQIEARHWIGPVVFLTCLFLCLRAILKPQTAGHRLLGFGLGFFLVTIFLVLQFMTVGAALMADRYSYLSYFGLIFGIVAGIFAEGRHRPSLIRWREPAILLFAALCFYLTTRQVQVWKNTETLWTNALRYYPENDQIREGLGDYFGKRNRIDEAQAQFEAALVNGSNRYHCYEGLANVYGLKGDFPKALALYDQAIRMDSTKSDVFYNRGLTLNKVGRFTEALRDFDRALTLAPERDTIVLAARAYSRMQLKQYGPSRDDYDRFLLLKPDDPTAFHNRGVDRYYLGDLKGAVADLRKALALKPDYEEARRNLSRLERLNR